MPDTPPTGDTPLFTREQVAAAVNAAADELDPMTRGDTFETSDTIQAQDRSNLFVNLAMGWLDKPDATADEIIEASYGEDAATVRDWSGI
jgi:hypothetical protein